MPSTDWFHPSLDRQYTSSILQQASSIHWKPRCSRKYGDCGLWPYPQGIICGNTHTNSVEANSSASIIAKILKTREVRGDFLAARHNVSGGFQKAISAPEELKFQKTKAIFHIKEYQRFLELADPNNGWFERKLAFAMNLMFTHHERPFFLIFRICLLAIFLPAEPCNVFAYISALGIGISDIIYLPLLIRLSELINLRQVARESAHRNRISQSIWIENAQRREIITFFAINEFRTSRCVEIKFKSKQPQATQQTIRKTEQRVDHFV